VEEEEVEVEVEAEVVQEVEVEAPDQDTAPGAEAAAEAGAASQRSSGIMERDQLVERASEARAMVPTSGQVSQVEWEDTDQGVALGGKGWGWVWVPDSSAEQW